MPEITPQQLRALELLDKVWNDPKDGETVRRAAKRADPSIAIPDENPLALKLTSELGASNSRVAALEKSLADFEARAQAKDDESKLRNTLGDVQNRFRFSDEAMAGTIKIMQDRQLADPEAAALLYRESLPKVQPTSAHAAYFDTKPNLFGTQKIDEAWRQLHEDNDGFFSRVVNEVFAEMPIA